MIPVAALIRLLMHIVRADVLIGSNKLREGWDNFANVSELDGQDFATLARIASGEAWEGL